MKILAIIPARGGSKGILKKNTQKLGGKPLIAHTIQTAKNCSDIDRIIVSTDDKEIANISRKFGAEVPFLRPSKLSHNATPIISIVNHCLEFLKTNENYSPTVIVLLQPTSPIRNNEHLKKSFRMLKNSNATSVISVSQVRTHPNTSFSVVSSFLKPLNPKFEDYSVRQKRKPIYHPTGSFYTFWAQNLENYNSIYGPKIKPLITTNPEFALDIDELFDLFVCEMTLNSWKKYRNTIKQSPDYLH